LKILRTNLLNYYDDVKSDLHFAQNQEECANFGALIIYAPDCLSILKVNLLLDANFILYNGEFRN